MKTKSFIMLCILFCVGLAQVSAQWNDPPKNGSSGIVVIKAEYGYWEIPVYCDGEFSFWITCPNLVVTSKVHWVNGEVTWGSNRGENHEWTSSYGEVFKVEALLDHIRVSKDYVKTRFTLVGDKGHVIINELLVDFTTGELIDVKSNCH